MFISFLYFSFNFCDSGDQDDDTSKRLEIVRDKMMIEVEDLIKRWDTRLKSMTAEKEANTVSDEKVVMTDF